MAIASATSKAGPYAGNGVTTAFAFAFYTLATSDVKVISTATVNAVATDTVLAFGTDYSVGLNADQTASPGGTVTLTTAPATGVSITVLRNVTAVQSASFPNQGGFYPKVLEGALDKLTMVVQQVIEELSRSIKFSVGGTTLSASDIANAAANSGTNATAAANSAASAAASAIAAAASAPLPSIAGSLGKYLSVTGAGPAWSSVTGLQPIGAMASFDNDYANGQNAFTLPTGETYLKTGVIADTTAYPNAPAGPWGSYATGSMAAPGSATAIGGIVSNGTMAVAGINGGGLYRSTDGFNWVNTGITVGAGVVAVGYGGGYFIAFSASSGVCYRSTDGINWTAAGNIAVGVSQCCYGNGTWVVASSGSTSIYYSTNNGTTWTASTNSLGMTAAVPGGTNNTGSAIAYGAGLFVYIQLATASGNYVTSPDGITWTTQASLTAPTVGFTNIVFGGTKFVIASNENGGANTLRYSTDGLNWTNTTVTPFGNIYLPVGYVNSKFVVGTFSKTYYSTDAITWSFNNDAHNNQIDTFYVAINGNYASYGASGTFAHISYDGLKFFFWYGPNATNPVGEVAYLNGKFVHTINYATASNTPLALSTDGLNWFQSAAAGSADKWAGCAYFNGMYCITGATNYVSTVDLISFTARTAPTNIGAIGGLNVANGRLYSLSSVSQTGFSYSADGLAWNNTGALPSAAVWSNVVYGNAVYVAHNANGTAYATSSDGIAWTAKTPTNIAGILATRVLFASGYFIATTTAGNWYKSADGVNWTLIPVAYGALFTSAAPAAIATDGTTVIGVSSNYLMVWAGGASVYKRVLTGAMGTYNQKCAALGNGLFVTRPNTNNGYVSAVSATNKVLNDVNYKTYNSTTSLQLDMYKRVA